MKVEKLLKRFKIEFIKVNLIQASLDSILFFLVSNLVFFLLSIQIISSIQNYFTLGLLTFLFFIGDLVYRIRTYHLEIYEEKNPELREVLRTARDNLGKSNTVSQALFDDLMERARSVTSESIIPSRKIIEKIILIGVLCFLTVGSGLVDFQLINQDSNIIPEMNNLPGSGGNTGGEENGSGVLNSSQVLGDSADIDVETRELNFDISGRGESQESEFTFDGSGRNISFESVDQRDEEDLRLAREYSLAIKDFN